MTNNEMKQKHAEAIARINKKISISREDEMIRQEKNAYQNSWRHTNKDKVKEYNRNYWLKKAKEKQRKSSVQ